MIVQLCTFNVLYVFIRRGPTTTPTFSDIEDDLVLAALECVVELLQAILQLLQAQQPHWRCNVKSTEHYPEWLE